MLGKPTKQQYPSTVAYIVTVLLLKECNGDLKVDNVIRMGLLPQHQLLADQAVTALRKMQSIDSLHFAATTAQNVRS